VEFQEGCHTQNRFRVLPRSRLQPGLRSPPLSARIHCSIGATADSSFCAVRLSIYLASSETQSRSACAASASPRTGTSASGAAINVIDRGAEPAGVNAGSSCNRKNFSRPTENGRSRVIMPRKRTTQSICFGCNARTVSAPSGGDAAFPRGEGRFVNTLTQSPRCSRQRRQR
jgi:hypothetical protein